jgi:DNA-binding SARP family transcriptional activator
MFREVRFEVLGPVRGWRGSTELELGSPQQRAVLAMLLLLRGRQVSLDDLIGGVWGKAPPESAAETVRTYVSRLRQCVDVQAGGPVGPLIELVGDGCALRGPVATDLDTFARRLREARVARLRDDTAGRVRLLRDALGLWRGVPLAGVPGPYADGCRVPLTELRMAALEEKLALDILLGDLAGAVAELRGLLAEYPFRAGLAELLVLALDKWGRQADALEVFCGVRQGLGDALGIDPGVSLQTMRQRVSRADQRLLERVGEEGASLAA